MPQHREPRQTAEREHVILSKPEQVVATLLIRVPVTAHNRFHQFSHQNKKEQFEKGLWPTLAGQGDVWKNLIRLFQSTHFTVSVTNRAERLWIRIQGGERSVARGRGGVAHGTHGVKPADDPQRPLRATAVQYAALPSGYLAALCAAPARHRPVGSAAPVPSLGRL